MTVNVFSRLSAFYAVLGMVAVRGAPAQTVAHTLGAYNHSLDPAGSAVARDTTDLASTLVIDFSLATAGALLGTLATLSVDGELGVPTLLGSAAGTTAGTILAGLASGQRRSLIGAATGTAGAIVAGLLLGNASDSERNGRQTGWLVIAHGASIPLSIAGAHLFP